MRNQMLRKVFSLLLLFVFMTGLIQPVAAQGQPGRLPDDPSPLSPLVVNAVKYDVSPPLREIQPQQPESSEGMREIPNFPLDLGKASFAAQETGEKDLALQNAPSAIEALSDPIMNFDGINNTYGVAPPDTQGDIGYDPGTGKKYYIQWVNLGFAIWDVTAGTPGSQSLVYGPANGNTLWAGFGGSCETTNHGDPITLYDPIAHRWLMSQFAVNNPYYQCIAVSVTADPTGSWYRYAFEWRNSSDIATMNDYPKFGVWPDGFYMTANQFIESGGGYIWAGTGAAVFERSQMLTGGPARMVYFDLGPGDWGGMLPSDLDGLDLPPDGSPNYFAEVHADEWDASFSQDEVEIFAFDVDWATTANSTFSSVVTLPMAAFDGNVCNFSRNCVPQQGTTQRLDAIGDRTMYRLAYRNFGSHETLASNLTVDANGADQTGVRWFELRRSGGTWSVYQEGTFAPDAANRWMGSIAQDHMGNLALGYSVSSSSIYPSVRYTGHQVGDPLGTMQAEITIHAGGASQSGVNRWGDYSMMSVDPVDDCTFWYTQEYTSGGWNWRTRIASFKFPNCTAGPTGTLVGTVTRSGSSTPIEGAVIQARISSTLYGSATSAADGTYTITLPPGNYDVTASAYGYQPSTENSVEVIADTTTTQDFNLASADLYQVEGYVRDATTNWPLYAHITISGDPFNPPPASSNLWTDPVTGYFSVNLASGITYNFHVETWVGGYLPKDQPVGPLSGSTVVNIGMDADLAVCSAPGYTMMGGVFEAFDAVTPPALPAGWAVEIVNPGTGTTPNWLVNQGTVHPSSQPAHSPPNLVYFNSYWASAASSARLYRTSGVDMTGVSSGNLSLWMYHDTGYTIADDRLQIQVSTDGGSNWFDAGSAISRYDGSTGWKEHVVDLSAYGSQVDLRIGLLGISEYGNDLHIDDINIGGAACGPLPGGLVVGNVYDENTLGALPGARVENDSGYFFIAQATVDPAVDDAFYTLFSPAGEHSFTAGYGDAYGADVQMPTVIAGSTIEQNFNLPAGKLTATPAVVEAFVGTGATATMTVTLSNSGNQAADFSLVEIDAVYAPPGLGPFANPGRHLGPKNLEQASLEGVVYYLNPPDGVEPLAAGDVIQSWGTGLSLSWGLGFNTLAGDLWVGNIDDALDYRFLPDGTATDGKIDISSWVAVFGADMAYNPLTARMWQVNVGGDNCIYEMDPGAQTSTGRKICPAFGTSQRGLAYDPITDTFYAGSWNDSIINHFDANGAILDSMDVALAIAGLAYNPSTGHLFVTTNAETGFDVYVLDTNNNYANLGGFDVAGMGNYEQAGMEFDCNGHLWMANQGQNRVLEVDSGETGVCDWMDIPWLSVDPITGTVPGGSSIVAEFTFDATGMAPGVYEAQVKVPNNTPYGTITIPVKMNVLSYAVSLAPPTAEKSGAPGTQVTYELTLTNSSEVSDTFTLALSGNSWSSTLSQTSVALAAGGSTIILVTVTVPVSASPGSIDTVVVTATSQGDPTKTASSSLTTTAANYSLFLPIITK